MKNTLTYYDTTTKPRGMTLLTDDYTEVVSRLCSMLVAKKVNACTWIKSIKRTPLYNGYDQFIIQIENGYFKIIINDHYDINFEEKED